MHRASAPRRAGAEAEALRDQVPCRPRPGAVERALDEIFAALGDEGTKVKWRARGGLPTVKAKLPTLIQCQPIHRPAVNH